MLWLPWHLSHSMTLALMHCGEEMGRGRYIPHLFGFVWPTWPLATILGKPAHAIGQQRKKKYTISAAALRSYAPPLSNLLQDSWSEGLRTWPECCFPLCGLHSVERERVRGGVVWKCWRFEKEASSRRCINHDVQIKIRWLLRWVADSPKSVWAKLQKRWWDFFFKWSTT